MRFSTRRTPVATYAAIVDDRVLWVALPEPTDVLLVPAAGGAPLRPSGADDTQPGHHALRFALAALAPGEHALQVGRGRPLLGPPVRQAAVGAEFALTRDEATSSLHVVRRPVTASVTLRAVRLLGERVELSLDRPGASGDASDSDGELRLLDGDDVVTVPIGPDGRVSIGPDTLAPLPRGERVVHLSVGGGPVRRRATDLADPGAGVPLPAVHPAGAPVPRARLRWSPEATLVLRLIDPGEEHR